MDADISIISWKRASPETGSDATRSSPLHRPCPGAPGFTPSPVPREAGGRQQAASGAVKNGTHADFLIGPENRLAGEAVRWMLDPQEKQLRQYGPLVLHGPSGTGKSHLARGLAEACPDAVHIHGADFARELAKAVQTDGMAAWRARYRSAKLFVLDDLMQLEGKRAAQTELLHALDVFATRRTPVVVTSRLAPSEAVALPVALRSRLSAGLVAPLSPPGKGARVAYLEQFIAQRGLEISGRSIRLLAKEIAGTMSDLRGTVLQLEQEARLKASPLEKKLREGGNKQATIAVVPGGSSEPLVIDYEEIQKFLAARNVRRGPSVQQIIEAVALHYGLKPAAITGPLRRRQIVMARSMAAYLAREMTGKSFGSLGKLFGGRDHSTLLYSCRMLADRLTHDADLRRTVSDLQDMLQKQILAVQS